MSRPHQTIVNSILKDKVQGMLTDIVSTHGAQGQLSLDFQPCKDLAVACRPQVVTDGPDKRVMEFENQALFYRWLVEQLSTGLVWRIHTTREGWANKCERERVIKKRRPLGEQPTNGADEPQPSSNASEDQSAPPPRRRGPPPKYEWTEVWMCDHYGPPAKGKGVKGPTDPNDPKRRAFKCRCRANLRVSQLIGQEKIIAKQSMVHNGHDPLSRQSLDESRFPPLVAQFMQTCVDMGLDWWSFRNLIRLSDEELDRTRDEGDSTAVVSSFDRILRKDYSNRYSQRNLDISRLHTDDLKSIELWAAKLNGVGAKVLFTPDSDATFLFCFVSKWQQQLMRQLQPEVVCIDSSHMITYSGNGGDGMKSFLTTVLAKHPQSGRAVPLAFMICSDERAPLDTFLRWLKTELNFQPSTAVIGSETEARGIAEAWPETAIRYGRWQQLKAAWAACKEHIAPVLSPHSMPIGRDETLRERTDRIQRQNVEIASQQAAAGRMRNEAMQEFIALLSVDSVNWDPLWSRFHAKWSQSAPLFLRYVEQTWVKVMRGWAASTVHVYDGTYTNNFIDSFHAHLKCYLRHTDVQRADFLIHVLADRFLPDVRMRHLQTIDTSQPLDTAEKESKATAAAVPELEAQDMITQTDEDDLAVLSFTEPGVVYRVKVRRNRLTTCNCKDNSKGRIICKHMFICHRILGNLIDWAWRPSRISRIEANDVGQAEVDEAQGEVDVGQSYEAQWPDEVDVNAEPAEADATAEAVAEFKRAWETVTPTFTRLEDRVQTMGDVTGLSVADIGRRQAAILQMIDDLNTHYDILSSLDGPEDARQG